MRVIRCPYCWLEELCDTPREAADWHAAHGCRGPAPRPPANPIRVTYSVVTK